MKKSNELRQVIESQLLQSTGKSFLDSGGEDGRHWQRNQKTGIDFNEDFRIDSYNVVIPIQRFMETMFDRDQVCLDIEAKAEANEIELSYINRDEIKDLLSEFGASEIENWFNTYNWDNDLSQDLQGVLFKIGRSHYAIIQVHQGADIRGGYSVGRVYEITDFDYFHLGQRIEVDNPNDPNGNPFESQYEAQKNGMKWSEKRNRWEFSKNKPARFYSSAMGF